MIRNFMPARNSIVKVSELTWDEAEKLGQLVRDGKITVDGTGNGNLLIRSVNPRPGVEIITERKVSKK